MSVTFALQGNCLFPAHPLVCTSFCIEALKYFEDSQTITLITDSKYVKDGIQSWIQNWKKNGWKTAAKKPVKNKELWIELDQLISRHTISWKWVKGHAGNAHNEKADYLARRYIEEA